jgi:hypothetical protein
MQLTHYKNDTEVVCYRMPMSVNVANKNQNTVRENGLTLLEKIDIKHMLQGFHVSTPELEKYFYGVLV